MLMRFDAFRELERMTQDAWAGGRTPAMPMDAYRKGDQFIVHFDLPGVDAASIELTVEQNVLNVSAVRRWEMEGTEMLINERPQGSFSRQLFLGETLDTDHLEARYDAGVLTLTIPVAERAKPRRIEVGAGTGSEVIEAASTHGRGD
jgi:HSP20 family protein